MKHLQKYAALALALALALTSLTACSEKAPKPRSAGDVAKDAVSMIETTLSETEMRTAIDSYAAALTEELAGGSAVAKFVDNEDGSVALVVQPNGINETQELMKFGSVKEAFSYFVYTGQMDADGKNITAPVVQTVSGNSSAPSETAPSQVTSDTTSSGATNSDVSSEIVSESSSVSAPESAVS